MILIKDPLTDLPKKALKLISKRQRGYLDEFEFYLLENGNILARYADEDIALWHDTGMQWEAL